VKEGNFEWRPSQGNDYSLRNFKPIHFFLFNDYLLLAEAKKSMTQMFLSFASASDSWKLMEYFPLTHVDVSIPESGTTITPPRTQPPQHTTHSLTIVHIQRARKYVVVACREYGVCY